MFVRAVRELSSYLATSYVIHALESRNYISYIRRVLASIYKNPRYKNSLSSIEHFVLVIQIRIVEIKEEYLVLVY